MYFYLPTGRDDTSTVRGLDKKARGTLTTGRVVARCAVYTIAHCKYSNPD